MIANSFWNNLIIEWYDKTFGVGEEVKSCLSNISERLVKYSQWLDKKHKKTKIAQ